MDTASRRITLELSSVIPTEESQKARYDILRNQHRKGDPILSFADAENALRWERITLGTHDPESLNAAYILRQSDGSFAVLNFQPDGTLSIGERIS